MNSGKRTVAALIAVGVLAVGGLVLAGTTNPRKGYAPAQPIRFPHKRMAGKPNWVKDEQGREVNLGGYDIPCKYCHAGAYEGRHATLPPTEVCMNCHNVVGQDKEWVLVLKSYWEQGKPIPWVKVHRLPDFAYFDHSAHLNAKDAKGQAKVDCKNCHGDVAETEVVSTVTNFNMGWCLDCHRKPEMKGPQDCIACHR